MLLDPLGKRPPQNSLSALVNSPGFASSQRGPVNGGQSSPAAVPILTRNRRPVPQRLATLLVLTIGLSRTDIRTAS